MKNLHSSSARRLAELLCSYERAVRLRIILCALLSVLILSFAGCGSHQPDEATQSSMAESPAAEMAEGAPPKDDARKAGGASPVTTTAQLVQVASAVPRKIIYNATVDLVSDNFALAEQKLMLLIRTHKGYVAERNVSGTTGAPRTGSWKIRVPVDAFDGFMTAVAKLGEVQTIRTDSQDVSEEFYDLQARISNKQVEEKRLIQLLQQSTAKLTDILKVEQELSRVRGEIEQMQGRLRVLANLTALTTVTVTIREVKDYVPPAPPTFTAELARTFQGSLASLRDFGKGIALFVVALLPWIPVLALFGLPFWIWSRRQSPRRAVVPPPSSPEQP